MEIKRLSQCSIEDSVEAWNRGFEGYFVQMNMTTDVFIRRMAAEDLSAEHSLVAFSDGEPVGIVLNGFRDLGGKKIAWNGGTGVATSFRGKGLSKILMEETLKIYEKEQVNVASLEAIDENEKAINLYKRFGYEITDKLFYLSKDFVKDKKIGNFSTRTILPEQLSHLDFYHQDAPWQCQWQSIKQGEAVLALDRKKNVVGYALYKKVLNQKGQIEKLILFQLNIKNGHEDEKDILNTILNGVVGDVAGTVNITGVNFQESKAVTSLLMEGGFKKQLEQVQMRKVI